MSNKELAISDNSHENIMKLWGDEKQLKEIKSLYAPKASDLEFRAFVEMGKATGLNPFLREIWLVKYDQSNPAQIFIGRDGYRKLLSRSNGYEGHIVDAVYSNDEFHVDLLNAHVKHIPNLKDRGKLLGAYCIAYMKGLRIPAYTFVDVSEYDLKRSLWNTHKATMIKKVAEAQTTRMAVQVCSGTYSPDEMPDHLLRDEQNKAEDLNRAYNLYEGEKINPETGEVTVVEQQPEAEIKPPVNDCPYSYLEVKDGMENASDLQKLADMASFISQLSISKEQHSELAKVYRERKKELEKA